MASGGPEETPTPTLEVLMRYMEMCDRIGTTLVTWSSWQAAGELIQNNTVIWTIALMSDRQVCRVGQVSVTGGCNPTPCLAKCQDWPRR